MRKINPSYVWSNESGEDLTTRCFALTSFTAALTLTAIFFWDIYIGESALKLSVLGISVFCMYVVYHLAVRFRKVQLGAVVASLAIILIVLPAEFFTGGGVYGCTPIWFAYAFLYIGLNTTGRKKLLLLVSLLLSAGGCYVIAYLHPEYLTVHDMKTAYLDSIASLIGVGVMLYVTVLFLMRIYDQERILAQKQKQEIADLNKAQNRFFSSMSHEIRTPINTIIGLNEMILREDISDEVAEDAANIKSAGRMLLQLINDILDMSKIESGQMEILPVEYDVGEMLSDIVGMLWLAAREKGLIFHVDVDPTLPARLIGDEVRIRQILINLLNNAIKYTKEGEVRLSIQYAKETDKEIRVIYTISDTGMGIRKESMPYLFSAFRRAEEEKNRYIEGTGLGLSIVKQFVDLMGGSVKVNSVYTKGSTFVIELPQKIGEVGEIGELNMEARHSMNHRMHYRQRFEAPDARILAVDDNKANLMVVTKLLRNTRVQIDTAESGEEALRMTLTIPYDLIFMDHMMPEMDGIECLHAIRGQAGGFCRESRVVALTANAGSENQALYSRAGFDGYLLKPVNSEELEAEVLRLLPSRLVRLTDESLRQEKTGEDGDRVAERRNRVPVRITTDSICDLPREMLKSRSIAVLPYHVRTKQGMFLDGIEMDQRGLLSYLADPEHTAQSEAPDVRDYETFFAEQLYYANNVIHITMTEKVGDGYRHAAEAAGTFNNVTVIDSGHLSAGTGILVLEAARLADEGASPERITEELLRIREQIRSGFIVDDTSYLARAGRIHEMVSRAASAFMLRPTLSLRHGKITVIRIRFGTKESARRAYIDRALHAPGEIDRSQLYVVHVGLTEKELQAVCEQVLRLIPFENVICQKASPAIAINCGPGTVGLLFKMKETGGEER